MRPRALAAIIALSLAVAGSLGCEPSVAPPNLLLVVLDTVRADAVGRLYQGRSVTPQVDRIASEGWRFTNAYATAPWTLPSHASLFTGLASSQHGAVHEHFSLDPEHPTLAEILAERGYTTHGITSNPWVGPGTGLARGFSHFEKAYAKEKGGQDEGEEASKEVVDKGAAQATDYAIDFIVRASESHAPFFLFVNYLEAHLPYAPPDTGFEALGIQVDSLSRRVFSIEEAEEIMTGERSASEEELALAQTLYLSEVAYQDRQLGRLLDSLRALDLLDETLVVITSDHGELLGAEGMTGHEFSLSDDVLRVPLVLRYPRRISAAQIVTLPVSHLDLLPTVLDALGESDIPAPLEGKSLLAPQALSHQRPLFAEYSQPVTLLGEYWATHHPDYDAGAYAVSLRSLRRGTRKLLENSRGEFTLVDGDPDGQRELRSERETVAIEMRDELASWIERHRTVGESTPPTGDHPDSHKP